MTNPEQRQRGRHTQPPHPANRDFGAEDAPPAVLARWEHGLATHGDAFAAFLTLTNIDAGSPDLEALFQNLYFASYPDVHTCVETFIEQLELDRALQRAEDAEPEIAGLVTLSHPDIEERLRAIYEIVEYGGRIHLFVK